MVRVPLDWTISTRTRKGGGCYISKLLVTIFVGIGLVIKLFMNGPGTCRKELKQCTQPTQMFWS